jgi:hypothetical protein
VTERPTIYRHPARPEWGHGILVEERDAKLILHWEDGQEHVVAAAFRDKLEAAALPDDDAVRIDEAVRGMRAKKVKADEKARNRAKAKPRASKAGPRLTFDEQLARFAARFEGGFAGVEFDERERGVRDGAALEGQRQAAITLAGSLLAAGALADAEATYEGALRLIGATTLVFPIEGVIPFRTMKPEVRAGFAAALRDLLHGGGEHAERFDRFVAALQIEDGKGGAKRPTWPLATILPALFDPASHAFIKPKLLQEQAAILGMPVNYQPLPSGAVYAEFRAVLEAVARRLREAGHAPRDLMDVAAFVWTTLAPAKAATAPTGDPAAAPATAG